MSARDAVKWLFTRRSGNQDTWDLKDGQILVIPDDQFYLASAADLDRRVRFSAANISNATDRTFTFQDANLTAGGSNHVDTTAATITVSDYPSGTTFSGSATSGTQTFTLPAAAAGLRYTFIANHASSEILINPATGDAINIMTFAAVGADADTARVAPAAGTGIKNTAATNVVGDNVVLHAIDGTTWYGIGITVGIWATQ